MSVDYLVLFPEDALVLLLAADLLVVVQLLRHLLRYRGLPLHSDLFNDTCICNVDFSFELLACGCCISNG